MLSIDDIRPFREIIPVTLGIPITLLLAIMGVISWCCLKCTVSDPSEIKIKSLRFFHWLVVLLKFGDENDKY